MKNVLGAGTRLGEGEEQGQAGVLVGALLSMA